MSFIMDVSINYIIDTIFGWLADKANELRINSKMNIPETIFMENNEIGIGIRKNLTYALVTIPGTQYVFNQFNCQYSQKCRFNRKILIARVNINLRSTHLQIKINFIEHKGKLRIKFKHKYVDGLVTFE
jgi:hypothetical protein